MCLLERRTQLVHKPDVLHSQLKMSELHVRCTVRPIQQNHPCPCPFSGHHTVHPSFLPSFLRLAPHLRHLGRHGPATSLLDGDRFLRRPALPRATRESRLNGGEWGSAQRERAQEQNGINTLDFRSTISKHGNDLVFVV